MKKKFSKKQLAAQRKFAQMARNGTLAKKRKSASKKPKRTRQTVRQRSGGTDRNRSNINDALLLAIKDPNVKEIVIRK